jgi:hypothetical protein
MAVIRIMGATILRKPEAPRGGCALRKLFFCEMQKTTQRLEGILPLAVVDMAAVYSK